MDIEYCSHILILEIRMPYLEAFFLAFRSDQISRVQLFATPWIAARQATLSITNSQSSLRPTSIESRSEEHTSELQSP